jgi:hypothetical protein
VLIALAIYFAFKPRLALTLFLLGPPAVCEVLLWLARRSRALRVAAWGLAFLLAVPSALAWKPRAGLAAIESAAAERARLVQFLDRQFPDGEPIGMPTGWDLGVETDRPVYGLRVTDQRLGLEAALAMVPKYRLVALVANLRNPEGIEYVADFARVYRRQRKVGNWGVFFTEPAQE